MKWIKRFDKFKESLVIDLSLIGELVDINESLNLDHDLILKSIGAEEIDIFETFNLPRNDYQNKLDIEYLSDNIEFINSLSSIGFKKSNIQNTDDYECFIKSCKFMFIYGIESNELENPFFVLFQTWDETLNKWNEVKLYKVNDDVKKFYDKLSSKIVEITDGDDKYIYQTSNKNEWELKSDINNDGIYKKTFRNDEFQKLIKDRRVKIKII